MSKSEKEKKESFFAGKWVSDYSGKVTAPHSTKSDLEDGPKPSWEFEG